jgi:hypothetical protein
MSSMWTHAVSAVHRADRSFFLENVGTVTQCHWELLVLMLAPLRGNGAKFLCGVAQLDVAASHVWIECGSEFETFQFWKQLLDLWDRMQFSFDLFVPFFVIGDETHSFILSGTSKLGAPRCDLPFTRLRTFKSHIRSNSDFGKVGRDETQHCP